MPRTPSRNPARRKERDVQIGYSTREFVDKLRRLADALEQGGPFTIQIASERVRVPAGAVFNVEHEREAGAEEVEFQLKWSQLQDAGATLPRGRKKTAAKSRRKGR